MCNYKYDNCKQGKQYLLLVFYVVFSFYIYFLCFYLFIYNLTSSRLKYFVKKNKDSKQ